MDADKRVAIGLSIAAAVVLVAAFMPWGQVRGAPDLSSVFGDGGPFSGAAPFENVRVSGMEFTMTITGWNGSMTVSGIALPNWLVVVAAAAVAGLAWLRAGAVWTAPRPVPFVLAGYGLVHAAGSAFVLMASDRGAAGIGSLLSAATFVGMLVILARQSRAAA